ncbi:MAG: copper resistance protein CopC [Gemmatimonadota bacterium]
MHDDGDSFHAGGRGSHAAPAARLTPSVRLGARGRSPAVKDLATATVAALLLIAMPGRPPRAASPESGDSVAAGRPHVRLLRTEPADGDTVAADLQRIRLVFSGAVEEAFSEIRLAGPANLDLRLDVRSDPTTDRALLARVPALEPGAYRAYWRIMSADGHAGAGSFVFHVRLRSPPSAGDNSETETRAGGGIDELPPPTYVEALGFDVRPSLALSRGAAVAALLALGGLLAMIAWIAPGPSRRARRLAYALAFLVPILLAGHILLWFRSVSPGGELDLERIPALLGTRAGGLEILRLGLAIAAVGTLAFGRHVTSAALLTFLAVVVSGGTGHALTADPDVSVPAKAVHLLAIQLWLGGLLYLVVEARDEPAYRTAARRVSRIALLAVLTLTVTGIIQVLMALPTLGSVLTTTYGWLVLAKSGGLMILVVFGYRNQFRLLPALEEGGGSRGLRTSVMWEMLVMAGVFLLAALLAYVPPNP